MDNIFFGVDMNAIASPAATICHQEDALEFFGVDDFRFAQYFQDERKKLQPKLEQAGYTNVEFFTVDSDSFGPLVRGVKALDPKGQTHQWAYS